MRYSLTIAALSFCLAASVAAPPAMAQTDQYDQSYESETPPAPPPGASPNLVLPPVGADGQFVTPNSHLTTAETVWHLRAALNVAALNCRDAGGTQAVADYNAMLSQHAASLARANSGVDAEYRARFGAHWENARETAMTKTYNFFAQPPAQTDFCPIAEAVLAEINDVPDSDMAAYAEQALHQVEAPFLTFYARYAAYRVAMNGWRGAGRSPVALGTVAAVPMVAGGYLVHR